MGLDDRPQTTDATQIELSWREPRAFAALFERHARSVHRYLVKRVGPQSAEDLVGETFVTAFRSRSHYDLSRPDARPWLFGIATNVAHHYWRSELRRRARTGAALGDWTSHDHSEDAIARIFFSSQEQPIADALATLDDAHLDVVLLIAGPGLTYEEVALALHIPVGTVRSRLSRARRQLRELLSGSWQDGSEDPAAHETPADLERTHDH